MDDTKIWTNVSRKLTGEIEPEQEPDFQKWLESEKLNHSIFQRIQEIWNYNPPRIQDNSRIWHKYRNRVSRFERTFRLHTVISYSLRISAILFLLIGITILIQKFSLPVDEKQLTFNEVFVPRGNRSFIVLPDSSKVWISNNSVLKYPHQFSGGKRELFLSGEAYFEVTHDEKKPFIVNIGENRIKVLGTKFSVYAYPEDDIVNADLISGKIQMDIHTGGKNGNFQSYILNPGHRLEYNKKTIAIADSYIPDSFYDYWLHGIYTFKNESLESLAQKVRRIYNIEIIFGDEYLKGKRYNGSFSINDNIFNFIEAIKQTSVEPVEYRLEGTKLFINLKKQEIM